MKIKIRTLQSDYLGVPFGLMSAIGWKDGDIVDIDVPMTGAKLVIYKESDPINHFKGVKEVING